MCPAEEATRKERSQGYIECSAFRPQLDNNTPEVFYHFRFKFKEEYDDRLQPIIKRMLMEKYIEENT
jgi:hypothetical protein